MVSSSFQSCCQLWYCLFDKARNSRVLSRTYWPAGIDKTSCSPVQQVVPSSRLPSSFPVQQVSQLQSCLAGRLALVPSSRFASCSPFQQVGWPQSRIAGQLAVVLSSKLARCCLVQSLLAGQLAVVLSSKLASWCPVQQVLIRSAPSPLQGPGSDLRSTISTCRAQNRNKILHV